LRLTVSPVTGSRAKSFPPVRNTATSSPNGKSSVASGRERQNVRSSSRVTPAIVAPAPDRCAGIGSLTGVLRIDQSTYDAIVAHARRDHPDEACGVVAGVYGSDRPTRFVPMPNAARSPTFYEFDSGDLLALYKEMDSRDEEPVVIYHSHTATEAYPSRTDVGFASEPGAHYVLVSTRPELGETEEFRSFRIVDGVITEEPVEVVAAW